jgi:hypothetical protein
MNNNNITYLEPPPERPLAELFQHLHKNHDYVKEVLIRLSKYIEDQKEDKVQPKVYPSEFIDYLQKAMASRFESYQLLAILGLILAITDFQSWVFQNENEHTRTIMLKELETSMHNYICSLKTNGKQFELFDMEPKGDKHEASPGWVVEHLRTIYNSC